MAAVAAGLVVAFVGVLSYQLGIFDRPEFVYHDSLIDSSNDNDKKKQNYLYAIVACTTEKNIGKHILRLMDGTKKGILETIPDAEEQMKAAVTLYEGANEKNCAVSIGLYFDNPTEVAKPRWCTGWAVQSLNTTDNLDEEAYYKQLQSYVPKIQASSGLVEPIRIVRAGKGSSILRARIPVRTRFSPMIAPMIHWARAYRTFESGGYRASHDGTNQPGISPALEVYIGTGNSVKKMDYVVLMGDVKTTFDDALPIDK